MDYEKFYAYLDSRPLEEIRDCMNNLKELVKKHTPQNSRTIVSPFVSNSPSDITDHSSETQASLRKLHKAQQVWTYQAVWNKFGSESADHLSPNELTQEASSLFTHKEVAQYIVDVTELIDTEAKRINAGDRSLPTLTPAASAASSTPRSASSNRPQENLARSGGMTPASSFSTRTTSQAMGGVGVVSGVKRPRENKNAGNQSIWSEEENAALVSAVNDLKDQGWAAIAAYVGGGKSIKQCQQHWGEHLKYVQQGLGKREWTEPELVELERLVAKHTIEPYWSDGIKAMTKQRVDWLAIGKTLNRIPHECSGKWRTISEARIINAPFSAQDDALILQREKEWGDKGVGLWTSLEKEMGRPSRIICKRWKELYEMNS